MVSHESDASRDGNVPRPVTLARLLTELAALPAEQRAAIVVLLSSTAPPVKLPTTTPVAAPACDEPDQLHPGHAQTK